MLLTTTRTHCVSSCLQKSLASNSSALTWVHRAQIIAQRHPETQREREREREQENKERDSKGDWKWVGLNAQHIPNDGVSHFNDPLLSSRLFKFCSYWFALIQLAVNPRGRAISMAIGQYCSAYCQGNWKSCNELEGLLQRLGHQPMGCRTKNWDKTICELYKCMKVITHEVQTTRRQQLRGERQRTHKYDE